MNISYTKKGDYLLPNLILKEKINKRVIFGFVFFLIGIYLQMIK